MQRSFLDRLQTVTREDALPAGQRELLARLRNGQRLLIEQWKKVTASGNGSSVEVTEFTNAMRLWDLLEGQIRFIYNHEGCVIGKHGCDKGAPVWCQACNGTAEKNTEGG